MRLWILKSVGDRDKLELIFRTPKNFNPREL